MKNKFIEIPASKKSIAIRKPIYGIGINDASYIVQPTINGKLDRCPYYATWMDMLVRCYSAKFQSKRPTYRGCSVVEEWLLFSNFKEWMSKQSWQGNALDKDIVIPNNKVYSPETCAFVTKELNSLLTNHAARRGSHPQGVDWNKKSCKYRAQIRIRGKFKHLGFFESEEGAESAYKTAKYNHILEIASEQDDDRVSGGLILHANLLK